MKKIYLTGSLGKGKYAIVDDDFYEHAKNYSYNYAGNGYAERSSTINGKKFNIKMHTEAIGGKKDGYVVDHINGNKLDNRRKNLRYCTDGQNKMNSPMYKKNKTGFKGVRIKGDKYAANIGYKGRYLYLGSFDTAEEAAKKYNYFAKHLHREFARLNNV